MQNILTRVHRGMSRTNSARRARRKSVSSPPVEILEQRILLSGTYRTIDGTGNNLEPGQTDWGSAGTQLLRLTTVEYEDGISVPAAGWDGSGRPNPRVVSNIVADQNAELFNDRHLTQFLFQWGQFVDHDLDLTEEARPVEAFSIPVPTGDPDLDPNGLGNAFIPVLRSRFDTSTGTDPGNPRQQINQITSFLDASNVYGSDEARAAALRTFSGGRLKTSAGNLLPYNLDGVYNAGPPPLQPEDYFLAGDIRSNEQPGLTALHTLFVREHNRLADEIAATEFAGQDLNDPAVDEEIYQRARRIVGAQVQVVTYREFLPALLGMDAFEAYSGYDPTVNPGIANIFSAAMYRIGHTMLPNELAMLADDGSPMGPGSVGLGEVFFNPTFIETFGIEPFLKGLGDNLIQEIDHQVVDGVRNLLFDPPAQFDLVATNLQRGRDHGLPDYNQVRRDFGLEPVTSFDQITSNPEAAAALEEAYEGNIENVDAWIAAISEDHVPGASVGELMHVVLTDQFRRVRDGDRFFYRNQFSGEELAELENTTLADIIRRNTTMTSMQDAMFFDRTMLYYRAPSGAGGADVRLESHGNWLELIDEKTGNVVKRQRLSDTSQVILVGNDETDDRFTIDLRLSNGKLAEGVVIHGGDGGQDELILYRTRHEDVTHDSDRLVTIDGTPYEYTGVEDLEIVTGRGKSHVVERIEKLVNQIVEHIVDALKKKDFDDLWACLPIGDHWQDRPSGKHGTSEDHGDKDKGPRDRDDWSDSRGKRHSKEKHEKSSGLSLGLLDDLFAGFPHRGRF